MPHDFIGWFHTIASVIALITGGLILAQTKGTPSHKRIGKVYGIAMVIVCASAFTIYRVHGSFGVLHVFAVISTITLALGMLPMYMKSFKKPMVAHISWMYWSVIGLYCAFAAELATRLPAILNLDFSHDNFYTLVGISTGVVAVIGNIFFRKNKKVWEEQFARK